MKKYDWGTNENEKILADFLKINICCYYQHPTLDGSVYLLHTSPTFFLVFLPVFKSAVVWGLYI